MDNFDIAMGAYDFAQIADLIDTLSRIIDLKQVGLFRDDGHIFIPGNNGPKSSKIHVKITRAFKFLESKIKISSKFQIVTFLDMTFNLSNNILKPFSKDNQTPTYINVNFNHPRTIIKHITNTVNIRTNRLSSN